MMCTNKSIKNRYHNTPKQARAAFWFLTCTIIQKSITIITTPIFTRLLNTEEYGQYSVFLSWMGILICFVTMNLSQGIYTQAIVKYEERRDTYSSAMHGLNLTLVVLFFVFYSFKADFWNEHLSLNTLQITAMFIIMWSNAVFGFWAAEQRVDYKYKWLVILTIVEAILQMCLSVLLILKTTDKVTGLVWGIALATFISYSPLLLHQVIKEKRVFSPRIWKYAMKLAFPLIPHYLSMVLLNSADRIMIEKMVGMHQAGIYNLAYTISMCGTLINQAVLQTLQPWIYQKIKKEQYEAIKTLAYPALIAIAGTNIFVILVAPELISIFAPKSYNEAIWVMPPIALSVVFMFMYNLFASFEFYFEKTTYISTATLIGALLNIILNYVLIRRFGYYAAGYTTLFCYITFAMMHYYFMERINTEYIHAKNIYNKKFLLAFSIITIAIGLVVMLTYKTTIIRYTLILSIVTIAIIRKNTLYEVFQRIMKKE